MKNAINAPFLLKNLPLKLIACILGYSFWCFFSATHSIHKQVSVPISFYNLTDEKQIEFAPETVQISLFGKRKDLYLLDFESIMYHINGSSLTQGTNYLLVDTEKLFLPDSIEITSSHPSPIIVKIK